MENSAYHKMPQLAIYWQYSLSELCSKQTRAVYVNRFHLILWASMAAHTITSSMWLKHQRSRWQYQQISHSTDTVQWLIFSWCKFLRKSDLTLQKKCSWFFCFCRMRDALTTLLPVDVTSSDRLLQVHCYFVQQEDDSSLQQPFRGQTDCREPSHSHGYSAYAHNDIINFQLSSFFYGFYFRGSRSIHENHENLHPAKIPAIQYTLEARQ